jgi:hypothetical protein
MGAESVSYSKPNHRSPKATTVATTDAPRTSGALKPVGGSISDDWNDRIINDTLQVLWLKNSDAREREQQINAAMAGLIGISPKDELEGMMAAQLIASHNAAMECYRRAMFGEQSFEGRRENLAQANKLSRTFATLLEALNRHRGKGQQKVTVEHVHVHSGGQAVVGVVEPTRGGHRSKPEEQPDANQIAHAPERAMWSADADRELVPLAGDAERPVPNARRQKHRAAHRWRFGEDEAG